MSDYYEYKDIKIDGKLRISPSGISKLYDNAHQWYKETILGEKTFQGNTNTVLGTIIHARIHRYYDGLEPIDLDEELKYIDRYKDNPDVNEWTIAEELNRLWDIIRLEYLEKYPKPDSMEQQIQFEIPNSKYFVGGSYDAIENLTLIDFKTTSTTPKSISSSHWLQLLIYALIMALQGKKLTTMRVVYIVKLKKEPKVVVLEQPITDEDIEFIKCEVKNLVRRLELVDNDKSLKDLLFAINPISRY